MKLELWEVKYKMHRRILDFQQLKLLSSIMNLTNIEIGMDRLFKRQIPTSSAFKNY
jgi:hypothetical protein